MYLSSQASWRQSQQRRQASSVPDDLVLARVSLRPVGNPMEGNRVMPGALLAGGCGLGGCGLLDRGGEVRAKGRAGVGHTEQTIKRRSDCQSRDRAVPSDLMGAEVVRVHDMAVHHHQRCDELAALRLQSLVPFALRP